MSLDVYLKVKEPIMKKQSSGIFVREGGKTKEISEEEWNERYPRQEPVRLSQIEEETDTIYSSNITHNLGKMASHVKLQDDRTLYGYLWRPEEYDITKASGLILPLSYGLRELRQNPAKYKEFNPENGWGTYEGLVEFTWDYLVACIENPDAEVFASR